MIALDLDQTLFGADLKASERVMRTISRARATGVTVTIATGRETSLAARFARELNIEAPIVCGQGACIYDPIAGKILREVRLPMQIVPMIVDAAQRRGWNIHFDVADQLYLPKESHHSPLIFELLRYSNWVRVVDLSKDLPEPPIKVVATVNETANRDGVVQEMEAELGEQLTIVASHPHLVEGLQHGVHKGRGLAWLADHLGVPQADVMAIGDSEADIPMLEWAGVGVAMGNASAKVKATADWVAPSLEEDGAAVAIERFVPIR